MRLRRAIVGAVSLVALIATAAPASAGQLDGSLSVSITGPLQLVNGVTLSVPVAVTCPATFPAPFTTASIESLEIDVTQNVGRAFAHGGGGITYQAGYPFGVPFGTPFVCDGTAQRYNVTALPNTDGLPFHGGRAVASAFFGISLIDPSNPFQLDTSFVTTGSQPVSIRG